MIVPVKKLTIITMRDFEEDILWNLGKLGVVQLRKLKEEEFLGFKEAVVEEVHKYAELLDRYSSLYKHLCRDGCAIVKKSELLKEGKVSYLELEKTIDKFESRVAYISTEISRHEQRIKSLSELLEKLQVLKRFKINPRDIGNFAHIFSKVGFMSVSDYTDILESIKSYKKTIVLKDYDYSEKVKLVHVTGLIDFKEDIEKVLSSYGFKEIILPPEVPELIDEAVTWAESEIIKSKSAIEELRNSWKKLKHDFEEDAYYLRMSLLRSYRLSKAQGNLLRSQLMSVMQGWVPKDKVSDVSQYLEDLRKEYSAQLIVTFEDPEPHEEVPSVYKIPRLFSAYQTVIRQYGIPAPHETDPTIISGILWTLMFGIMFPDFGEGLIITVLGIYFAFIRKGTVLGMNPKRIGRLMIVLGTSAMFFGLLAGEVFLLEDIIHPLWPGVIPGWVHESYYVLWLLKLAIFFGIAEMILGMVLNIRTHLKHGHKIEALMGEHGLAGIITFIGIVLLAFYFVGVYVLPPLSFSLPGLGTIHLPAIDFPALGIGAVTSWPIALIILGIIAMLYKSHIEKEGLTIGFSMAYETVLSFMTNMFSFARIAGFCIAHAALAIVVARLMEYNVYLGIGMGLIFLNAFALTLEFVVVIIQATRLTFYEFLTKFYAGEGKPYIPFKV